MKVAIALSGGGARCVAQLGYLKTLYSLGVEIQAFSGSSGGAITAGLLASGRTPTEAFEVVKNFDYSLIKLNFKKGALFSLEKLKDEFEKMGFKSFQELKITLIVTLTRYEDGEKVYKREGDLASSLLASSALIPIFAPVEVEGELYIDGGFSDNLPLQALPSQSFKLAINVNPLNAYFKPTFKGLTKKALYTLFNSTIKPSLGLANHLVQLEELGKFGILERKEFDAIYKIGERAGEEDRRFWENCLKEC